MITPTAAFKKNLSLIPSIESLARIELVDASGAIVATIENAPGKQGSLAVYQYLQQSFGTLNAEAAAHGMAIFAEHTPDAQARPGAHPNIDRLIDITKGAAPLTMRLIPA